MPEFVRRVVWSNGKILAAYPGEINDTDFPPSGVVPGTYPAATITVDQYGRVTAASAGTGGAGSEMSLTFGWNNASPRAIGTVPAGNTVARVRLAITTPFADAGSSITVGTAGAAAAYMAAADNELLAVAEFETTPLAACAADTEVLLAIARGGAEASGAGIVVVEFEPTSGG